MSMCVSQPTLQALSEILSDDDGAKSYFQLKLSFLNRFLVARKCRIVWVGRDLKCYVAFLVTVLGALLVKCCVLLGIKGACSAWSQGCLCNTSSCGLESIDCNFPVILSWSGWLV